MKNRNFCADGTAPVVETVKDKKVKNFAYGLGALGTAIGIAYSIKTKKKMWAAVGYTLAFSVIGSSIGLGVGTLMFSDKLGFDGANEAYN